MDIKEALAKLDVTNDAHWTANGSPKMESVNALLGYGVTRKQIIDAAPKFTRENPSFDLLTEEEMKALEPEVTLQDAQEGDGQDAPPEPPEDSPKARAAQALPAARERLENARAALAKANDEYRAANAEVDRLVVVLEKEKTAQENQLEIQRFLRSQHEQRVKRAEEARAAVTVKSPIDQALTNRKKQGAQARFF